MSNIGYWIFGKDMLNVNLENLKEDKVTDLFLNYYAFTVHGESKVLEWIKKAKNNSINVHIWMQCFYDGEWHNPKTINLENKIKEAKKYANMKNVYGVHLDYLRYSGNAYKTNGGAEAITEFVKRIRNENPKTFLSCAVMPEKECKYYYGQDIEALGKIVDAVIPMQYKGNYKGNSDWLASTTKQFSGKANIWSGLQTYKSDNDTTKLSTNELLNDAKTCLNNGAKGIILFRYGLSENINFGKLELKNKSNSNMKYISKNNIVRMARDVKSYIENNHKVPYKFSYDGIEFTFNEMQDIMTYHVLNPNSGVNADTYKWCANANGDNIVEDIKKDDYLDQARRVHNYIMKNGQVPNFVTTVNSKKRVNIDLFSYCVAKIIVWYADHNNTYPNYCTYDYKMLDGKVSSSSPSLNSYMTNQGCSGMGQCTGYYCACNSLQQCFYRLTGIKVAESTIAGWAGTTSAGTGHWGIETAVSQFNKVYGKNIKINWKNFSELGNNEGNRWSKLQEYINKGAVFCHILYRGKWGHYEVPQKVNGSNLSILNSLGNSCGGETYCGYIETRDKSTQLYYINGISQKSIAILTV